MLGALNRIDSHPSLSCDRDSQTDEDLMFPLLNKLGSPPPARNLDSVMERIHEVRQEMHEDLESIIQKSVHVQTSLDKYN